MIGLFVIFIGVQYIAYDAAYSREGVRVAATVTSLVELSSYDSGSEYIVHYRFTTAEGRLMAGSSSVAHPAYFESHRAIRIQYVRSRPEHSRIGRSAVSESFTGGALVAAGFLVAGYALVNPVVRRSDRWGRLWARADNVVGIAIMAAVIMAMWTATYLFGLIDSR